MIIISTVPPSLKSTEYNYLICPKCKKGRLCDKPKNEKVSAIITKPLTNHIIIKCPKCSETFVIESH